MPDIYTRLTQLKEILRHMFEIGQELNKEVLELTEKNNRLLEDRAELEAKVERLERDREKLDEDHRSQLIGVKEHANRALVEKERIISEKQKLIDGLNKQIMDINASLVKMREERTKDQTLQQLIADSGMLQDKIQEYKNKNSDLEEARNSLETEKTNLEKERQQCAKERQDLADEKKEFEELKQKYEQKSKELNDTLLRMRGGKEITAPVSGYGSSVGQRQVSSTENFNQASPPRVNAAETPNSSSSRLHGTPPADSQSNWDKYIAPGKPPAETSDRAAEISEMAKKTEIPGQGRKTKDFG